MPVDVRQASPAKRLELQQPARYAKQLRLTPDAGSVPHFADERGPRVRSARWKPSEPTF